MSELVTTRIRATAAKLGLPHLAGTLTEYVQRADAGQMGYLDFGWGNSRPEVLASQDRAWRVAQRGRERDRPRTNPCPPQPSSPENSIEGRDGHPAGMQQPTSKDQPDTGVTPERETWKPLPFVTVQVMPVVADSQRNGPTPVSVP